MGRNEKMRMFIITLAVSILSALSLTAGESPDSKNLLETFKKEYPFIVNLDTVFTTYTEFPIPDGFHFTKDKNSDFSNWISNIPLWTKGKTVGDWRGLKKYDSREITRVIHLPWKGKLSSDFGIAIRLLAEYLKVRGNDRELKLSPSKGEILSYDTWLTGKPVINIQKGLIIEPEMKREPSDFEYYSFLNFMVQHSDFKSVINICDSISENDITPGDMYIAVDQNGVKGEIYVILNVISDQNNYKLIIAGTGCETSCDFHIPLFSNDPDNPWISTETLKSSTIYQSKSGFYRFRN